MKYKKYITLTLSIFVLFCCFGIAKEADACKMKKGPKGVTVNGQCVRFSSSGCGNFNLNSGHYGGDQQCALLGRNCPPPPPPPVTVCTPSTRCNDGKGLDILRSDCSTGYTSCMNLGCTVGASACKATTTGSIQVTRFGSDLNSPSSAPSGTETKIKGLSYNPLNPLKVEVFSATSSWQSVSVTALEGYYPRFGFCTYNYGDAECNINESEFVTNGPHGGVSWPKGSCSGGFCTVKANPSTLSVGTTWKVAIQYVPYNVCTNGATNPPACTTNNGSCLNGATNPPTCNNGGNSCTNGATNPPACTTNNGSCLNGATNPPTCDNGGGSCTNGATNPPACTKNNGSCINGATNPPTCDTCTPPASMVNGSCLAPAPAIITTFKPPNDTVNKNTACTISVRVSNATQCKIIGTNIRANGSPADSLDIPLVGGAYNSSITTGNISDSTRYTLICNGPTGTIPTTKVTNCYINQTPVER